MVIVARFRIRATFSASLIASTPYSLALDRWMCYFTIPEGALSFLLCFPVQQWRQLQTPGSGHANLSAVLSMDRLIELGRILSNASSIAQWKGVIFINEKEKKEGNMKQ